MSTRSSKAIFINGNRYDNLTCYKINVKYLKSKKSLEMGTQGLIVKCLSYFKNLRI
ncbi:hypothetical protein J2X77_000222 [Sphingobacterium sp. 2149]|nr:hypothetical protein [Sphingobacterium sp. 2149]